MPALLDADDRCSIQRQHDQRLVEVGSKAGNVKAALDSLEVPQPDVTSRCKAMIGYCQAMAVWMLATVAVMQRLAKLNKTSANRPHGTHAAEVGTDLVLLH